MRVRVDRLRCKGYGLCAGTCPEVFDLDEAGKAVVLDAAANQVPAEVVESARKAALLCPERAIEVAEAP